MQEEIILCTRVSYIGIYGKGRLGFQRSIRPLDATLASSLKRMIVENEIIALRLVKQSNCKL